jgi:hypothetical protein
MIEEEEIWREVFLDFEFINKTKLEASNLGRLRITNKLAKERILNFTLINGYPIIRLKFYRERTLVMAKTLAKLRGEVLQKTKNIETLTKDNLQIETTAFAQELTKALADYEVVKTKYRNIYRRDELKRTKNYAGFIHRLVATCFCEKPSDEHIVVAHKDYNRLNNRASNLVWMTKEENLAHRERSPYVIAHKKFRKEHPSMIPRNAKLTTVQVSLIKKRLSLGSSLKTLAKQFKVSEMQMHRIKTGENWSTIEAAT